MRITSGRWSSPYFCMTGNSWSFKLVRSIQPKSGDFGGRGCATIEILLMWSNVKTCKNISACHRLVHHETSTILNCKDSEERSLWVSLGGMSSLEILKRFSRNMISFEKENTSSRTYYDWGCFAIMKPEPLIWCKVHGWTTKKPSTGLRQQLGESLTKRQATSSGPSRPRHQCAVAAPFGSPGMIRRV